MRKWKEGDLYRFDFDSVNELTDYAEQHIHGHNGGHSYDDYSFTRVRSTAEAFELAREGWTTELDATLRVAEEAVSKVEREIEFDGFLAEHGVSGVDVDIDRYLTGEPECMIDYPLRTIVKAGKVITLCASIVVSAAITPDVIIRRGQTVAALALALGQLGYSTEIWADWHAGSINGSGKDVQIRTLVKGPQDALDPERVIYALAHPSMLRVLGFATIRTAPREWLKSISEGLGQPRNPIEDMPEGTIYLPCLRSNRDVPDAAEQLTEWLRQLEIID